MRSRSLSERESKGTRHGAAPGDHAMKSRPEREASKREPAAVDPRFVPVVEAFAMHQDVTRGRMMSSYGLKVKGKIFAMFGKEQFVVKLPKERVDALVSAGLGKRFDPGHGRLMKEWVVIGSQGDWVELAKDAYRFVKQLSSD
jgi:TfoX/Sxy family transcriptional regulator of competence genes